MKFSVKFKEQQSKINVNFSDTQYASDGGFERGYEQGYQAGYKDGENSAYTIDDIATNNVNGDIVITATSIADGAFYRCKLITTAVSDTVKSIGYNSFLDCTGLKKAILKNCETTTTYSFSGCSALEQVECDNLLTVGVGAFQNCKALKNIVLPKATTVNANGFVNCSNLDTVVLRTNEICNLINVSAFNGTPIKSGTGYIYVPDALVEQYKSATNWSTYASQIKPLSELVE